MNIEDLDMESRTVSGIGMQGLVVFRGELEDV